VFLADMQHTYLGRICHWKDCRAGARQACDALNCGAIKYLHDHFKTVTLNRDLIAHPPLKLWPVIVIRTKIPADIQKMIIDVLK
jgi:hypothetical protein